MATTGDKIKSLRMSLGMTQGELARKVGYKSKTTINKIEAGKNNLTQTKISKFAQVLGVTPSSLLPDDNGTDYSIVVNKDYDMMMLIEGSNNKDAIFRIISYATRLSRISKDYTEKYLASKLGISLEEYIKLENNCKDVSLDTITKSLENLNVNFYYLFGVLSALDSLLDANRETGQPENIMNQIRENTIKQIEEFIYKKIHLNGK